LASLRAHKTQKTSSKSTGKGKGKILLMNLDDEDDDEEAAEEMQEHEGQCLTQLENSLSQCARCGKEKKCKIDKDGNHANLTFQQLRAWALSLVIMPSIPLHPQFPLIDLVFCRQRASMV
jgi:hypothetical protein